MSEEFDLIVIGSGAAGLAAALSAAHAGARVALLEKSRFIGGTTSFSGALLWAPLHGKSVVDDPPDDRDAAVEYVLRNSGACDRELVEAYIDSARETVRFLEDASPLRLLNTPYPDTFPEGHGGRARGRHLEPHPYSMRALGAWRARVRPPSHVQALTHLEMFAAGLLRDMRRALPRVVPRMIWRGLRSRRAGGQALVGALLDGALRHGIDIRLEVAPGRLLLEGGRVAGVECSSNGETRQLRAHRGVVLACGGFEWSPGDVGQYLPVSLEYLPTPPLAMGDNLRLAAGAGAKLSRMGETWHWPTGFLPGSRYETRDVGTLILTERAMPHSMIVNGAGRRIGNESAHNFALAMYANTPAWVIFDRQYRERYPVLFRVMPKSKDPEWLLRADSLAALARAAGIDPDGLAATAMRFNELARSGRDPDFHRGESAYDRYFGDVSQTPNPCLGTIERPPFYALRAYPSAVGTRGGPKTTPHAQVIDERSQPIAGLYAAGNAAACFHGETMIGGGATVMAALIFGRRAAMHAIRGG